MGDEMVCSDNFSEKKGSWQNEWFVIHYYFAPYQEERPGGDRLGWETWGNKVCFYIADATGHGNLGAHFWERNRLFFDQKWQQILAKKQVDFWPLLDSFHRRLQEQADGLCMALGQWGETLETLNFGYGSHILIQQREHCWTSPFGVKLGWPLPIDKDDPDNYPLQRAEQVQRLILMTDSLLGDDYANPKQTLELLSEINQQTLSLPHQEVIGYLLRHYPSERDDSTIAVIEKVTPRVSQRE